MTDPGYGFARWGVVITDPVLAAEARRALAFYAESRARLDPPELVERVLGLAELCADFAAVRLVQAEVQTPTALEAVGAGWLTTKEARGSTGLSEGYLCRLARAGRVRSVRRDGWALLLHPDDVAELAARRSA